jgi:tetratricopeptide (TPR) repeat protein
MKLEQDMYRNRDIRFIVTAVITCVLFCLFAGCGRRFGKGNSPVDLYVDAVTLQQAGYPNEAIEKLDTAIKKEEDFSQAYSLKGDIYQQMQQYEKSAQAYQKATELNTWSFYDFFNLGKVYQAMKKFAEAVRAYVRACELQPDHLQAHINTAECYNELKQYDNVLLYAQRAEQIDPNVTEPQRLLGDAYEGKEDYEHAISSYKRALELDANDVQVMTSLAVAYLRTNSDEPAMQLLTSAVELDSQNGRAYRYLGYTYLRLYEQTASRYNELVQQSGTDKALLDSLKSQGDEMVKKAIDNYSQAIEIDQNDWDAHRGLGVAYIIDGKKPDGTVDEFLRNMAIEHWRKSLQINPDQPRADRLRDLIAKYRSQ